MIKCKLLPLVVLVLTCIGAHAQTSDFDSYLKEGVRLYDNGDYTSALEQYKKALLIDSTSSVANYEMASTYFAIKEYQKAIDFADKVIKQNTINSEQAFILKGSALDVLGNSAEAVNVYKTGQIVFPNSYLLYYNLALTLFNTKGNPKEIEQDLQLALNIKPTHASSHLLLAYLMTNQNKRVQALLAIYNFLLIEPKTSRSIKALQLLDYQLKKGVKKDGDKNINITLALGDKDDEFSPAELMLSMLEASKNLDENKNKTAQELFISNTQAFFSVLSETTKDKITSWWKFYTGFFNDLQKNKMDETFCNYIRQSQGDDAINTWLKKNTDKIDALLKWSEDYRAK